MDQEPTPTPQTSLETGSAATPALSPALPGGYFCYACGKQIDSRAFICPHCGVRQQTGAPDSREGLDPGLAALISIIGSPVIAMLILKRFGVAAMYLVGIFISIVLAFAVIGFFMLAAIWIGGAYHAYTVATKQRLSVDR